MDASLNTKISRKEISGLLSPAKNVASKKILNMITVCSKWTHTIKTQKLKISLNKKFKELQQSVTSTTIKKSWPSAINATAFYVSNVRKIIKITLMKSMMHLKKFFLRLYPKIAKLFLKKSKRFLK